MCHAPKSNTSQVGSDGEAGRRCGPTSRCARTALQLSLRFSARRLTAIFARVESSSSDAVMGLAPSRRLGLQTLSMASVVGGGTSPLIALRLRPLDAPFAQRVTLRLTVSTLSRGAEWERATHVHIGGPSAQTAGRTMVRVRMPASSRGVPASPPGCGGHHPPTKGARSWGP